MFTRTLRLLLTVLVLAASSMTFLSSPTSAATAASWSANGTSTDMANISGGDGNGTATTCGGVACLQVSPQALLYWNVTSWSPSETFARVDVTYYDDPALVGDYFFLQYGATATVSSLWYPIGSGQMETATFHLRNVDFSGKVLNGAADFRLNSFQAARAYVSPVKVASIAVSGSTTSTVASRSTPVVFDPSQTASMDGLVYKPSGDGVGTIGTYPASGADRRKTVKVPSATGNIYFDVDDGYIYQGNYGSVSVDVTYFDQGYGFFYLNYDSTHESGTAKQSNGPSTEYLANNIVYLQDSRTFKTYTFNLANVYFGNRLNSFADFRITQPHGSDGSNDYDVANQGYDLRVSKVTVTRSSTPIDRIGMFEGNYSGFGPPAYVWTGLGSVNEAGHGLYQNESSAATSASVVASTPARVASSGSIYFDINDNYLRDGQDSSGTPIVSVLIGVHYFDSTGSFSLEYDGAGGAKSAGTIALGGSNTWKRTSFYITDGRFNNSLSGGNDFRLISPSNNLAVHDVVVERTLGTHVTGTIPRGFSTTQKIVGASYFPIYDGFRPSLWEHSTTGPTNADPVTHIDNSYSARSIATHAQELTDMKNVGVDFAYVWMFGNSNNMASLGVVGIKQMVAAAEQVQGAPKFGLLLDQVALSGEPFLRDKVVQTTVDGVTTCSANCIDYGSASDQGQIFKMAEDFFALVPRSMWATIEGRPIIALYYQGGDWAVGRDPSTLAAFIDNLRARIQATHGVDPYIVVERLFDPNDSYDMSADEWWSSGSGLCDGCVESHPGYAQRSTMAVGPGFSSVDGRRRDRDDALGNYYTRSWDRALGKGNHMILIDTWNYFVEGAGIAASREYGRQYLDITQAKVSAFKAQNYSASPTASVSLGSSNTSAGLYQDDVAGALTQANPGGGRQATGTNMYFSVNDGFAVDCSDQTAQLTVEYLDSTTNGPSFIDIKYTDKVKTEVKAGSIDIVNSNTGGFRTQTFSLPGAAFGNYLTGANDLRFDAPAAGMVIKSVTLSLERAVGGALPSLPPGFHRLFIGLAPSNTVNC